MRTISELEDQVRDFINNPRKQSILLQNRGKWNQLCSSLDVIGDTELAIDAYTELLRRPRNEPWPDGEKYLTLYGILQALFLQQDAVKHMTEALGLVSKEDPMLTKIRELRNNSVGHPTKRGQGKAFNFIVRMSVSLSGFTLMTTYPDDRSPIWTSVDVPQLVNAQRALLQQSLNEVIEKLKDEEMEHRKKYRDEKLASCFPETLSYFYEKISETIRGGSFPELGALHVKLVIESIEKFKALSKARGLLEDDDPISYELELVKYPMDQLKNYFDSPSESKLNAKDAYIFLAFIIQKIDLLKKIAKETDEEYATDL